MSKRKNNIVHDYFWINIVYQNAFNWFLKQFIYMEFLKYVFYYHSSIYLKALSSLGPLNLKKKNLGKTTFAGSARQE